MPSLAALLLISGAATILGAIITMSSSRKPTRRDIELAARTVVGEARGDGEKGMAAVAHVIRNRAARPAWWGSTLTGVILKPRQFSAWNEGDPNRPFMLALSNTDDDFLAAKALVTPILEGQQEDPTGGATHYHTRAIKPWWSNSPKLVKTVNIGEHVFYRRRPFNWRGKAA